MQTELEPQTTGRHDTDLTACPEGEVRSVWRRAWIHLRGDVLPPRPVGRHGPGART